MKSRPWAGPSILVLAAFLAPPPAPGQTLPRCGDGCSPRPLACGGSLAGELSAGDCLEDGRFIDVFTWQPAGPSEVELRVRAEGFEPRLLVHAITDQVPCFLTGEGDDSCAPGSTDTTCYRYDAYPFPQLVFVTSVGEAKAGSYTIEAACGSLRCDPACRAGAVACSQTARGDLGAPTRCPLRGGGSFETWDFSLEALSRVSISASAEAPLFASLHFEDPFGFGGCFELVDLSRCDGGRCLEAVIDAGAYHLATASPTPGGAYELSVACEPFDSCVSCPASGAIACGEPKAGRLGPEDCELLFPAESGVFRTRTERWAFAAPAAGLYRVSAAAPGGFLSINVVKPGECSPAYEGFPEPCPGPGEGVCSLFTLGPGQHWVEVVQNASGPVAPSLDYSLEVKCIDLGPCEDCLRGTMACGGTASGELAEGDCKSEGGAFLDILALDLEPGPPRDVTITLRSSTFSPRLLLLDRICGALGASATCEGGPGGSACLTTPSGSGGKLFVGVTATATEAAGAYELEVTCPPFSPCAPRCQRGAVSPGSTASGELSREDCTDGRVFSEAWTLSLESPGLVDISVETEHLGGGFQVWNEDCSEVFAFSEGSLDGQRSLLDLPSGSYSIVVNSSFAPPDQPLAYTLRVRSRDCKACAPAGVLACEEGGLIEGTLGPEDCADPDGFLYDSFTIETPVMREIFLSSAPDFGSLLWILEEDCAPRAAFAIGGVLGIGFILEAGRYTVVVTSFAPGAGGNYALRFSCKTTALCSEACIAGTLECGKSVAGALAGSDCSYYSSIFDAWRFEVPAGGEARIDVRDLGSSGLLSYSFFRAECTSFLPLHEACEFPLGGPAACRLEPGTYTLTVEAPNFLVFGSGAQPYEITVTTSTCEEGARRLPGDCNQDSRSELGDVYCVLGYLFQGQETPLACGTGPGDLGPTGLSLLDWDGNARLNIVDVVRNILYLFRGGPPHPLGIECVAAPACSDVCEG